MFRVHDESVTMAASSAQPSVETSVSFVSEEEYSGDEVSLRPNPPKTQPKPSQAISKTGPSPKSESIELSSSDLGEESGEAGPRPHTTKKTNTRDGVSKQQYKNVSSSIPPSTTGQTSFAETGTSGMSSSVLGEQTNLGSSAESSKPATPAAGGSGQVLNPQPQKEQGRTTPSGFTSSVPGTSYNSSFEEGNISYGESGNATPRRPASPPPAGAADERQGLAEGALGQASQGDKQRHRPTQGDGASQHSSDSQHQHQQQDQQRKQQQQLMSTSVASLEPSQTPQLPPGLRSGAREPLDPASLQAALQKQQEAREEAERAIKQGGLSSTCGETGVDIPSPLQLFMMYDRDGSCAMGMEEFGQMLYDLDGMDEVPEAIRNKYIIEQFDMADLNHDGVISVDEFYFYFYRELCFKFPILRSGVNPGADLFNIFVKYATFGRAERSEEMTSNQFSKLCKDCKLINNKTVMKADIDIIFSRCRVETDVLEAFRPKMGSEYTTARMMYPQFLFGLLKVAEKRRSGFQEVVARIIENVSAVPRASMADLLVFQNTGDPKQAEEWVARPRGLPKLPHLANDASERMQREAALAKSLKLPCPKKRLAALQGSGDQGGPEPLHESQEQEELQISEAVACTKTKKKWGLQGYGSAESLHLPCTGRAALTDPRALMAVRKLSPDHLLMGLKRVFERYNKWQHGTNKGTMDKIRFNKMMRDARFVRECGPLSATMADHLFHRCLPMVEETLNFMQFLTALKHVAAALRISLNEVMEAIVLINAPLDN